MPAGAGFTGSLASTRLHPVPPLLTFQEFLTARAMVEGWHPGRKDGDTLASVLEPHFEVEQWREVVPLAAVLGGNETEALIRSLTQAEGRLALLLLLLHCLADEAAARPETIRAAIRELVNRSLIVVRSSAALHGRYEEEFRSEACRAFLSAEPDGSTGTALLVVIKWQLLRFDNDEGYTRAFDKFNQMLGRPERLSRPLDRPIR